MLTNAHCVWLLTFQDVEDPDTGLTVKEPTDAQITSKWMETARFLPGYSESYYEHAARIVDVISSNYGDLQGLTPSIYLYPPLLSLSFFSGGKGGT